MEGMNYNGMECEIVGSRPIGCVCNLPIKKKKKEGMKCDTDFVPQLHDTFRECYVFTGVTFPCMNGDGLN